MLSPYASSVTPADPFASDDVSLGVAGLALGEPEPEAAPVPPPRVAPSWVRDQSAMLDVYGHYTEPDDGGLGAVSGGVKGFLDRLGKRDGVQVDKDGVGFSALNTAFRFMPIIPGLND